MGASLSASHPQLADALGRVPTAPSHRRRANSKRAMGMDPTASRHAAGRHSPQWRGTAEGRRGPSSAVVGRSLEAALGRRGSFFCLTERHARLPMQAESGACHHCPVPGQAWRTPPCGANELRHDPSAGMQGL